MPTEKNGDGSLAWLRDRNRRRVMEVLRMQGRVSQADISRATGLSRTTVSTMIAELRKAGLVLDNQPDSPVKIEVIQAGVSAEHAGGGFPPIPLERTSVTGLRHTDGAISMARGQPDSATSGWFICINDQPSLDFGGARNPDGQGFAAFGRVA